MKTNNVIDYMNMARTCKEVKDVYDEVEQALYTMFKWEMISGNTYYKNQQELHKTAMDRIQAISLNK